VPMGLTTKVPIELTSEQSGFVGEFSVVWGKDSWGGDAGDVGWQATQSSQGCRAKATIDVDYVVLVISISRFVAKVCGKFRSPPRGQGALMPGPGRRNILRHREF
jgi:hypothetical protein